MAPTWVIVAAHLLPPCCAVALYLLYRRDRLPWLRTLVQRDREAFTRDSHFFAKLFLFCAVALFVVFLGPVLDDELSRYWLLLGLWPAVGAVVALVTGDLGRRR